MVPVFITTCAEYSWLIRPQAYLLNAYWSPTQLFTVMGFKSSEFELPDNFSSCSPYSESCPIDEWSNALIHFLKTRDEYLFVLLLDDYWPIQKIDNAGIEMLAEYMRIHTDVLKIDLTDDRLFHAGEQPDVDTWGQYDIIETPFGSRFQMSLQVGIWNRELMLNVLIPGKTPWKVEFMQPPKEMRVLGTRQILMRYAHIQCRGNMIQKEISRIPQEHRDVIMQWFPE